VVTKEKYNNSTLGVPALGDRCWDMYDEEKPIESYPEPCRSYFEEYFSGISPPGGAFDS
jgi:hypothetical protein